LYSRPILSEFELQIDEVHLDFAKGILVTISVLILALRGGVWLGSDYLWVLSMQAMRS
jgi:hypothetical protein